MKRLCCAAAIVAALVSMRAAADPCTGPPPFSDIAASASFCTDAAWARNANIAQGCAVGFFCPGSAVTRGAMVLFLNRTARETFPKQAFAESATLPAGDLDTAPLVSCTTNQLNLLATGNAAFAHVHAVVSMQAGGSAADVQLRVGHSVNGGAFTPDHTTNPIVSIPAGHWGNVTALVDHVKLLPGTSNVWRVELARAPGSATTGELTGLRCQLKVLSQMDFVAP